MKKPLEEAMVLCERPIDYKAYRLTLTSPMSKDELISVGRVAAIEAYHSFVEGKGMSERSWMLTIAEQRMFKHTRSQIRKHHDIMSADAVDTYDIPVSNLELEGNTFVESLQHVSPASREVVGLIFRMPLEIAKVLSENKPKKTRGRLRSMLRTMGWKDRQINESFREIKGFLLNGV